MAITEFDVLITLHNTPGRAMRMTDLAGATMLSSGGMTRLVGRLEQRGFLLRTPDPDDARAFRATLTPDGEQVMATLPELRKREDKDGTTVYFVPIASKKIVAVTKVTMSGPNLARVEYTWQWNPTAVGEIFDTNSKYVKTFNIWDTQTLISKYDVNYYHGEPAKAAINMVRGENDQWKPSAE